MSTPKGTQPWNAGTAEGWINQRGYHCIKVGGRQKRVHRLRMEQHLGRALEPWEHVHHKDGNKLNNELANLELVEIGEHAVLTHAGTLRRDSAKQVMATFSRMREEVRHLRAVNSELADALEALLASDGSRGTYDAAALLRAQESAHAALRKAGRLP